MTLLAMTRKMLICSAAICSLVSALDGQTVEPFAELHVDVASSAESTLRRLETDASTTRPAPDSESGEASASPTVNPVMDAIHASGLPAPLLMAQIQVESGGNRYARSPKGALGLWQLMPDTARRLGLIVSDGADQRLDPMLSTHAAIRYLTELYRRFGRWDLVMAAYNAGEGAVQRAIDRGRTTDFADLAERKLLPAETRAYVPAIFSKAQSERGIHQ